MKFAIVGLGFISDRHIQAIKSLGHEVYMSCDIDPEKKYKANGSYFFDDFKKMIDDPKFINVDYVSICTPNYYHFSMILDCLDRDKKVICEKPPVISREAYDTLMDHPKINNLNIVLQCRYANELKKQRNYIGKNIKYKGKMLVEIYRDEWYMDSWKSDKAKSGGLLYNIGCHYIDILGWYFGKIKGATIIKDEDRRVEAKLEFNGADIDLIIAIDTTIDKQKRIFELNNEEFNLTQMGFEGLHKDVYEKVIDGLGLKLKEFYSVIEIIEKIYD